MAALPRGAWERLGVHRTTFTHRSLTLIPHRLTIVPTLLVVTHPETLRVTNHNPVLFLRLVLTTSVGNKLVSCW